MVVLNDIRRARGLTQMQLAESSGVRHDVISSIETGRVKNPTWNTVRRLSVALDVPPDVLFPADDAHAA